MTWSGSSSTRWCCAPTCPGTRPSPSCWAGCGSSGWARWSIRTCRSSGWSRHWPGPGDTSTGLAAYAAGGRAVIVLEQRNPLRYQAMPAQMEAARNEGRAAFAEDLSHPVLRLLQQKDFFAWGPDEIVYRDAYLKPQRGGRSLIQCDHLLQHTALVEIPAGKGVLLLSQLALEEKLANNAVAQQLLANLLVYGADYKLTYRTVSAALEPGSPAAKAVDGIGLN